MEGRGFWGNRYWPWISSKLYIGKEKTKPNQNKTFFFSSAKILKSPGTLIKFCPLLYTSFFNESMAHYTLFWFYIQHHSECFFFKDGCFSRYPTSKGHIFFHIKIITEYLTISAAGSEYNKHCVYISERQGIIFQ